MIRFGKKAISLLLVAVMTMVLFTGCGTKKYTAIDEAAVLMTVGDTKVTAGMVNFYIRYQQSLMESLYSANTDYNIWAQEVEDGETYETTMKEAMLEEMQTLYILSAHVADYEVSLTEDELASIETQATAFEEANSEDAKEKASATKEYAIEYMKLKTIAKKMETAMKQDIDTEVDQEEAKQKRMRYVVYKKTTEAEDGTSTDLSDDEIAQRKKDAESFLTGAKANGSLEAYATEQGVESTELTFDADTEGIDENVIKEADKLEENAFSGVIDTEEGYYVVQLESLFDSEATDAEIESILETRGQERYEELLEKWTEEIKIDVDEKVWKQIRFDNLKVNYVQPEEESEETDTTDTTESTDSTETTTE